MMLAKLSATATSRQIADSTRMTAARPLMSFIGSLAHPDSDSSCPGIAVRRTASLRSPMSRASRQGTHGACLSGMAGTSPAMTMWTGRGAKPIALTETLLVALGGGEEHLPQRLELGLGLDDVVADRRHLFHQLGMVGGRQGDDLAALLGPGLALADQEIERPGEDFRLRLPGGRHHEALKIGRQAVEPFLAQHGDAEDVGVAGLGHVFGRAVILQRREDRQRAERAVE